jgi:hypothetical protein
MASPRPANNRTDHRFLPRMASYKVPRQVVFRDSLPNPAWEISAAVAKPAAFAETVSKETGRAQRSLTGCTGINRSILRRQILAAADNP